MHIINPQIKIIKCKKNLYIKIIKIKIQQSIKNNTIIKDIPLEKQK